jgi:hypothetical protein
MSTDFVVKSNSALDALILSATDPETIREIVKSNLASAGIISRERGNDYGARVTGNQLAEPPAQAVSLPEENHETAKCFRRVYPHENDTYEIYGETEEELDKKEAEIRARY